MAVTEEILGQFLGDETFPVTWEDPSDADLLWTFDQMHAPEPMTLADAVAFQCAFDHGVTWACTWRWLGSGVPVTPKSW